MPKKETPTPSRPAADSRLDIALRLNRAYAVLTRRLDAYLSGLHGLNFGDFMTLYYLHRAPANRLRRVDLAERLGLTASGVTRILLPLEKIGLVSRQPDARDARVGYAALTGAGTELFGYALASVAAISHDAMQNMSNIQIDQLSLLLGQLGGMHSGNQ